MVWERTVVTDGIPVKVTVSDEQEALLAAYAAGGAVVGFWDRMTAGKCLAPAEYLVESMEAADGLFLERVARRRLRLPWVIAETERLIIREFVLGDLENIAGVEEAGPGDGIFIKEETLKAYIDCQYRFYEYGIWAVVEKESGRLIGKAGISGFSWGGALMTGTRTTGMSTTGTATAEAPTAGTPTTETATAETPTTEAQETPLLELGYHIFAPWRQKGYAKEACEAIISYASEYLTDRLYARINENNNPSARLAEGLGFRLIDRVCSAEKQWTCLYVRYCP